MAYSSSSFIKDTSYLDQLLEEINFQRAKEMRQLLKDDSGFVVLQGTTYWTDLFVRHFLFHEDRSIDCDDLLFFVRKKHVKGSSRYLPKYETDVEVFRRDSKKLPIGDPDVDWEETVYLNLIIHQFEYTLTLAICTRTSPRQLQVLKKHSQKVYASPSRRKMDSKGEGEEMTYPHVCFTVDNFDEVFSDISVRDGEMLCVELVAVGRNCSATSSGLFGTSSEASVDVKTGAAIFLGSVRYDALNKLYDARTTSLSTRVAQRMSFWRAGIAPRCEFVLVRGAGGRGAAEVAVSGTGRGNGTPQSEPDTDWYTEWEDSPTETFQYGHQRRLSDPSANVANLVQWRTKSPSGSELELDLCVAQVQAGDPRDELDDGAYNPLWTMRGCSQSFHIWKENKRLSSSPVNAVVTYVTLPWWSIAQDILDKKERPILTF